MIQEKYVYNNDWIKKNILTKKKKKIMTIKSWSEEGWRIVEGFEELGENVVNRHYIQSSLVVQRGIMTSVNTG